MTVEPGSAAWTNYTGNPDDYPPWHDYHYRQRITDPGTLRRVNVDPSYGGSGGGYYSPETQQAGNVPPSSTQQNVVTTPSGSNITTTTDPYGNVLSVSGVSRTGAPLSNQAIEMALAEKAPVPEPATPEPATATPGLITPMIGDFNPKISNRNVDLTRAVIDSYGSQGYLNELQTQKQSYAENWWNELPIQEKIVIGVDTVMSNLFTGGAKSILEGKSAFTPQMAYENVKGKQADYKESGYWGGFGKSLIQNQAATTVAAGFVAGAGLGAVSQIPKVGPAIATSAGGVAVGAGVKDIAEKLYTGNKEGALAETLGFAATVPFAAAGFEMAGGKGISFEGIKEKIPAISIGKPKGIIIEAGEMPIVPKTDFLKGMPSDYVNIKGITPPEPNMQIAIKGKTASWEIPKTLNPIKFSAPIVPLPQLTGSQGQPADKWELYAGPEKTKTTSVFEDIRTPMGDRTIETKSTQRTADLYVKVPPRDFGEVLNSLSGETEYVKTAEGSYLKIKPAPSVFADIDMGKPIDSRLGMPKAQNMIGDFPRAGGGKLPSISDYIRLERKLPLTPAELTRVTVPERLALPKYTADMDISPEGVTPGKGSIPNDVWGGTVKGRGMYPETSLVEGVPDRLQLTPREVTDFDVQLSLLRKASAEKATTDLADSVKNALEPDYGKYTGAYEAATKYAATEPQISKVETPHSPVKVTTVMGERGANKIAQGIATEMQKMGQPVVAKKNKVMTIESLSTPPEILTEVEFFNQAKVEATDRFDKDFNSETLMGMNSLSTDVKKLVRSQQGAYTNQLGRYYGENTKADIDLFQYPVINGLYEPAQKRKQQPTSIWVPRVTPQPSPRVQPFPEYQPEPQLPRMPDVWGGGGGVPPRIPKIPKMYLPDERKRKKAKTRYTESFFQNIRRNPVMPVNVSGKVEKELKKALGIGSQSTQKRKTSKRRRK